LGRADDPIARRSSAAGMNLARSMTGMLDAFDLKRGNGP
jgi:hypothetical protein